MQTNLSTPSRKYVATLIPRDINFDEVEYQADQGLLPTHPVSARNAAEAGALAHRQSGRPVFRVERALS